MPEPINLLPPERRRLIWRRYFLRLGTVATCLAMALAVGSAVLLIPTFAFLQNAQSTKQARLANLKSVLSSAEEAALAARLSALSADAANLLSLAESSSVTDLLREALMVPRPGIALSGLVYAPPTPGKPATLALTGVAASRNVLRAYQLALLAAPQFSNADLPVSSYAKDRDIPFTITVSLVPSPSP